MRYATIAITLLATTVGGCGAMRSGPAGSLLFGADDDHARGIETAKRWECVDGTFLDVAARNFGFSYLSDTAVLVNLFTGGPTKLSDEFRPHGGCNPEREKRAQPAWSDGDWVRGGEGQETESHRRPKGPNESQRAAGFGLDFALLGSGAATDSRRAIRDGERLRQGDRFQVAFTPNSQAYVYIYSIDSTGWVQALYPDPENGHLNPVHSGAAVFLPRSERFYGLDEESGQEEIWVLASPHERSDVAGTLSKFPLGRSRVRARGKEERIRTPSVVRGAVVVDMEVVEAGAGHPLHAVVGDSGRKLRTQRLFHIDAEEGIVFSRWFQHE